MVTTASNVALGSSFVLNFVLASSLSLIFGLINALQLTTHFPLLNIDHPINASMWYG